MVRALLLTVCLTAAWSACYSPPEPACGFFCGPNAACPGSYHCASDKVCHLDGTPDSLHCGPDAGVDAFRFQDARVDTFPPQVVSNTPVAGAQNVALDVPITVTFDEPALGVDLSTFIVTSGTTFTGVITTTDQMTYVYTPSANWPAASQIDVQLLSGITDQVGNHFFGYFFSFTTQ